VLDKKEILSNRDLYPFDNYAERMAYIRSTLSTTGTLEEECSKPLITLIVGGANVGKSSLFNLLVGKEISPVKEISGYTRDFFIAADQDVDLNVLDEISPSAEKIYKTQEGWMDGRILVDTPDFDSINDFNRKRLEQLIPLAHVVVVLVTVAKREIAPLVEILLRYVRRKTFIFVMNKQDREDNYQDKFTAFLNECGFTDPLVIRASCAIPSSTGREKESLPATGEEWDRGIERVRSEIGRVDEKRAKTRKYQGDVRDSIELLYSPTQVRTTLRLLEEKKKEFNREAEKFLQAEISSTLSSLANHPRIIRDVVLMEVAAGRRWFVLSLLLRIWTRHRILLAMTGAGSFLSRASGSVLPFFSAVASGLLFQTGQVSSIHTVGDQVRRGLKKNSFPHFFQARYQLIRKLLARCRIRKDFYPPEDLSSTTEEFRYRLEQAVEKYLSTLVKKSYRRILTFLEIFVWTGTAGYLLVRARSLYLNNQMTLETMVFAAFSCVIILTLLFLTGFIFYIGISIRKNLEKKIDHTSYQEGLDFSQPLQPAIEALKHFARAADEALGSIGSE